MSIIIPRATQTDWGLYVLRTARNMYEYALGQALLSPVDRAPGNAVFRGDDNHRTIMFSWFESCVRTHTHLQASLYSDLYC